ncbi:MAG: inositol monophosphatase [Candidatus Aureabacteria bacterium]|nr:inositol monophosphatase [Candidatus Auribacterota bacterium]
MLETAVKAAKKAGELQIRSFGKKIIVDEELRFDTKLALDKESERLIVDTILAEFPDHSIIAEESGVTDNSSDYTWIIDPLDGTANFSRNIPQFCSSIALLHKSEKILGVVFDPVRNELFHAEKGKGSFLNGRKINTRHTAKINELFVVCGFMKSEETIKKGLVIFNALIERVKKIRIMGAAALDLCWLAAGRFDVYFEYGIMDWDIAAGELILKEAGGDIKADALGNHSYNVTATNGKIKPEEFLGLI